MNNKREFIFSIIILVVFVGSMIFLYLSFTQKDSSNLFLILALACVALGNFLNFINWTIKRKNKKLEEKENK